MAKLRLSIPNIPDVPVEDIDDGEWTYIRHNYPAEYKQAQREIKEYNEAHPAEEAESDKDKAEAAPKAEASKGAPKGAAVKEG